MIYRRERADMVQLFKIMNGYDKVELHSISVATESVTRGHHHKLEKHHYKYKSSMKSFTARSIDPWKNIPSQCIESEL